MLNQLREAVRDLKRRAMLAVARTVIHAVDDASKVQNLQIGLLAGEIRDRLERFQEYGFSSVPLPGAEAIAVFIGGNRDHGVVVAVEDGRYRPGDLQPGEVVIYTDEGDKVYFRRGRKIEVVAGTQVTITTPLTIIEGELQVTGNVTDQIGSNVLSMKDTRDTYNSHNHPESGGGTTLPPNQQM